MSETLLATKIHIPPLRSNLVHRQALIQRLGDGISQCHRLALISAPAGYGKSTLLSEWASQIDKPIAWLSLEKGENSPAHFWSYFITAISTISYLNQAGICESFLGSLQNPQPPPMEELLIDFINDLGKLEHDAILILDDFHFITESQIHRDMVFLIDHLPHSPHTLHLVVASRMDPPWPLARWRGRGELTELRSADLRFTFEEASKLLNQIQLISLSDQDIDMLHKRTEGWIVGLQMASLSIQGILNTQGSIAVSHFIESFTGSNRFVLDYLVDEVINQQSPEVQDFLYDTAVLEQFSAPLCDAILGRKDSHEILSQLEKANLFLIPLDDDRQWFRYHHLFTELLNIRLKQNHPSRTYKLHQLASRWFAENNVLSDAIIEALKANDIAFVDELVSSNSLAILEHNELLDVIRHFEELPDKTLFQKPWLFVAYAWVKAYSDPSAGLDATLGQLEDCLERVEIASEQKRLIGNLAAIRAYVTWVRGESEQALEFSRVALANLPDNDWITRCNVLHTQGLALQYLDQLPKASESFEAAIIVAQRTGRVQETFYANTSLAFNYYLLGKLHQAFSISQQVSNLAEKTSWQGKQLPFSAYAYFTMSLVQLDWNEVKSAVSNARSGLALAEKWHQADTMHMALNTLSKALCAAGDVDGAFAIHQRAILLAENVSSWYLMLSITNEIQLYLAKGEFSAAVHRFSSLEARWDQNTSDTFLYTKALLQYEQGKMLDLLNTLEEGIKDVLNRGEIWFLLRLLPLQALALDTLGQQEEALSCIARCLDLAEPEGFVRIFIERGTPMFSLLQLASSRGIHPEYINRLLPAFKEGITLHEAISDRVRIKDRSQPLLEPLSERELQVLRLLQSAMTSEEISRELFISVNTTRTHIRNIYSKLAVHGRIEAIQKAKEIGII